jgi:hypothetical protein
MAARLLSLTRRSRPTTHKHFLIIISVRRGIDLRAVVRLDGIGKLKKKCNDLIGTRARDLPAYSIASQPTTLPTEKRVCVYCIMWLSLGAAYRTTFLCCCLRLLFNNSRCLHVLLINLSTHHNPMATNLCGAVPSFNYMPSWCAT